MDELMRTYLQEIPKVIHYIVDAAFSRPTQWNGNEKTLVLIGSGSSQHAFLSTRPVIQQWTGCVVDTYYPHAFLDEPELNRRYDPQSTVVIGLSQTGTSSGTFVALRRAKSAGYRVLTLTGNSDSPIARLGDEHINLQCGEELTNAKTKGYSASMVQLMLMGWDLGRVLKRKDPCPLQDLMQALRLAADEIPSIRTQTTAWVNAHPQWAKATTLMILGHAETTALAMEGALKLSETHYIPVLWADADEYMHGFHRLLDSQSHLILIEGQGRGRDALSAIKAYARMITPQVLHIGPGDDADIRIAPWTIIPPLLQEVAVFQTLAVLWPDLANQEPNAPRHPDLVEHLKSIQLDVL